MVLLRCRDGAITLASHPAPAPNVELADVRRRWTAFRVDDVKAPRACLYGALAASSGA